MSSHRRILVITAVLLLSATFLYTAKAYKESGLVKRKQVTQVAILQSSERILDDLPPVTSISGSFTRGEFNIYVTGTGAQGVSIYNPKQRTSKKLDSSALSERVITADPTGNIYALGSGSSVEIFDPSGRMTRRVDVANPASIAAVGGGRIAAVTPTEESLLRLYNSSGNRVKQFGKRKETGLGSRAQEDFFNDGKVVVNPTDGTIYYVPTFSLSPTVQKFTNSGEFISEFQVEGDAIDFQADFSRKFLRNKGGTCIGGFFTITSAAIDATTGHLWIGMNGSSKHGVVYEYSAEGRKLREYAFLISESPGSRQLVTGVDGLAVNAPYIYLLTSQGHVYRFDTSDDLSPSIAAAQKARERAEHEKTTRFERLANFVRASWSPFPSPLVSLQLPCPIAQPLTCTANCDPSSTTQNINCGASAAGTVDQGDRIIGQTDCNNSGIGANGQPTCVVAFSVCRANGDRYSTTYTATCNPPPPTPTPEPTPTPTPVGGDTGICFSDAECRWRYGSPIWFCYERI